jgi:hypothetical protein
MFPVQLAGLGDEPEIAVVGTDNQERIISKARHFFICASFPDSGYLLNYRVN